MPKRTNEFQRLVAWIQRALAPEGAKVTESALLESPILAGQREIDVLIEGEFGPYLMKIAVEAKDETRKLDIVRFDSIVQKYQAPTGIAVNKVVIFTRSGFTRQVVKKAILLGVELFTLHDAQYANWKSVIKGTSTFRVAPHICGVAVVPLIPNYTPQEVETSGNIWCDHGRDHGTVRKHAAHVTFDHVFRDRPKLILNYYTKREASLMEPLRRLLGH